MKALKYNYIAFLLCTAALLILKFQSEGVEGGMDSWQHFLISKYALKYPDLFLDQWNKPVFTIVTTWFCQGNIDQLVVFNIFAITLSALFVSLAAHNRKMENSWLLIPFVVFMPELFLNSISGLTEPLAMLMISVFIFLWSVNRFKSALILASFLPFVRTEGFVLLVAVIALLAYEKRLKMFPWLLVGSLAMNVLGFIITSKPFWIITENPYWKHEMNGTFDPGSGSLLHFIHLARPIFGAVFIVLATFGILLIVFHLIRRKRVDSVFIFSISAFILYFSAHSLIFYLGILGSHGLTRPMALLSPFIGLLAYYPVAKILEGKGQVVQLAALSLITVSSVYVGYRETHYPYPYKLKATAIPFDKSQIGFLKAGNWLKEKGLMDRVIVHQSPYFNCKFNKDPYDTKSSYYVWSINQQDDWSNDGTIVIWDGFSARREGNMPLEWLQNNDRFMEILYIKSEMRPDDDPERFDIRVFEKMPVVLDAE